MAKKYTTEEWIEKAREIHGDKYDYSKVNYINSRTKVCITCPKHGEFWQNAHDHLQNKGCPNCWKKDKIEDTKPKRRFKLSNDDFIKRAKEIHGDKYDYSKVDYKNSYTKVCIVCPIHGEFWQRPDKHLHGHGCPKCRYIKSSSKNKATKDEFIEKARKIHGDKYDYSKTEYVNTKTKVCIICPKHGEFWQIPHGHLSGKGCPSCKLSHLEEETRSFLADKKVIFVQQKKFKWLGLQSIDFYLPQYNVGIECQGIQHFKEFNYFGGKEKFARILELDERKKELCEENGVKLLYYSNLHIEYPYHVYENKEELMKEILKNE